MSASARTGGNGKSSMADLDVQVQLSLRDDLSRPAKKAMDAVRAASRTAEGGMGGVAKQAAKAGLPFEVVLLFLACVRIFSQQCIQPHIKKDI